MELKTAITSRVIRYLQKHRQQRKYAVTVGVLSIATAVLVFSMLTVPVISMEKANPLLQPYLLENYYNTSIPVNITATARTDCPETYFVLYTRGEHAELSDVPFSIYYEENSAIRAKVPTDDGGTVTLHQMEGSDGIYWFSLLQGESVSFDLNFTGLAEVMDEEEEITGSIETGAGMDSGADGEKTDTPEENPDSTLIENSENMEPIEPESNVQADSGNTGQETGTDTTETPVTDTEETAEYNDAGTQSNPDNSAETEAGIIADASVESTVQERSSGEGAASESATGNGTSESDASVGSAGSESGLVSLVSSVLSFTGNVVSSISSDSETSSSNSSISSDSETSSSNSSISSDSETSSNDSSASPESGTGDGDGSVSSDSGTDTSESTTQPDSGVDGNTNDTEVDSSNESDTTEKGEAVSDDMQGPVISDTTTDGESDADVTQDGEETNTSTETDTESDTEPADQNTETETGTGSGTDNTAAGSASGTVSGGSSEQVAEEELTVFAPAWMTIGGGSGTTLDEALDNAVQAEPAVSLQWNEEPDLIPQEVVKQEQEKEPMLLSFTGDDYEVMITYTEEANIPEGAELAVFEIANDTEEYSLYYRQTYAALQNDLPEDVENVVTFARFFDISIVCDGIEVEPTIPVDIKISYSDSIPMQDCESASAVHFADSGIEILPVTTEGERNDLSAISFTQDSFSVTAVVLAETVAEETSTDVPTYQLPACIQSVNAANEWQIVSGQLGKTDAQVITTNENGHLFRMKKQIVPTGTENEFLIYLDVEPVYYHDWKEVFLGSGILVNNANNEVTYTADYSFKPTDTIATIISGLGVKNGHSSLLVSADNYPLSKTYTTQTSKDIFIDTIELVTVEGVTPENATDEQKIILTDVNMVYSISQQSSESFTIIYCPPNGTKNYKLSDIWWDGNGTEKSGGSADNGGLLRFPVTAYKALVEANKQYFDHMLQKSYPNLVEDTMGDDIEFLDVVDYSAGTTEFDSETNTLTWDLSETTVAPSQSSADYEAIDETDAYALNMQYQLVYKVRLMVEKGDFVSCAADMTATEDGTVYDTNQSAKLSYTVENGVTGTAEFTSPQVRGLLYNLNLFKYYTNYDGEVPLDDAEFTLYDEHSQQVCTGTTGEEGILRFTNLPHGTYTLKETKAPDGFMPGPDQTVVLCYTAEQSDACTCDIWSANTDSAATLVPDERNMAFQSSDSGDGTLKVINEPGVVLPETGGSGTFLYTTGGMALLLTVAGLLLYNHKRHRKEDRASG